MLLSHNIYIRTVYEITEALDKMWLTTAIQTTLSPVRFHGWKNTSIPKMVSACAKDSWSKITCQQRKPCPWGFYLSQFPSPDRYKEQRFPCF